MRLACAEKFRRHHRTISEIWRYCKAIGLSLRCAIIIRFARSVASALFIPAIHSHSEDKVCHSKHSLSSTNVYQSHTRAIPFLFQKWHLNQRTRRREARSVSGNPSAVRREREMQEEAIKFISSASVLANTLYTRPPLILMILVGHASPRCLLSSAVSRSENFINNSCHKKEEGTDKKKRRKERKKRRKEGSVFGNTGNISQKI